MAYKKGSLMIFLLQPNASFIKYVSQQSLGYVSGHLVSRSNQFKY